MNHFIKIVCDTYNINKRLLPWLNEDIHTENINYNLGIIINNKIIIPFNIYTLYAKCYLLTETGPNIELEIHEYCYYRRLISLKIKDNIIKFNDDIICETYLLNDTYIKLFNEESTRIYININFKLISMDGSSVYPFIFMESSFNNSNSNSELELELLNDNIIAGMPIYNENDIIIGIVYKFFSNKIIIIPIITINNFINIFELKNIFSCKKYNNTDDIISINGIRVTNNNIEFNNIVVSYNTYLWYTSDLIIKIEFYRDNKLFVVNIKKKILKNCLNISYALDTIYETTINKITFCKPNLLLYELLTYNNLIIRCISLLNYYNKPFNKRKYEYCIVNICYQNNLSENNLKKLSKYINYVRYFSDDIELLTIYSDVHKKILYFYNSINNKIILKLD